MKLMYICLFLSFVATLVYGDDDNDCFSERAENRRLEDIITKISDKHNGENELEFLNWLLDPVNYTILYVSHWIQQPIKYF